MNERIKELAFAATEGSNWKPGLGNPQVQEYIEKFAELVIEDVLKIIADPVNYNKCVYTTHDADRAGCVSSMISSKIKEYYKDTE